MDPIRASEIERRKYLEMLDSFPTVAIIQSILAATVLCYCFLSYGVTTHAIVWTALFLISILYRYWLDRGLRPFIFKSKPTKKQLALLLSSRAFIGLVWSIGSIGYIEASPDENFLAAIIWCSALAYAGCLFHQNSVSALLCYFWSIILPLSVYMALVLDCYKEAFILIFCGIAFVILYIQLLHQKVITRIDETITKERLIEKLSNANLSAKLLAEQDALTKLKNRTFFNQKIVKVWRLSHKKQQPLSVVILDIDHFKAYNDNYGHIAGDKALRKIAKCIKQINLESEHSFFARVGGEEFIAVLPNTEVESAVSIANLIREKVEDAAIPHEFSSCSNIVTISAGVSSIIPPKGRSFIELIEMSDKALYQAKEGGRNRVSVLTIQHHAEAQEQLLQKQAVD
jgi:diguanylate cyclase (GGDEF)-like protein